LGDFHWLALTTASASEELRKRRADLDRVSSRLRDKLAADLYAIEEECGTPLVQSPAQSTTASASSHPDALSGNASNPMTATPLSLSSTKFK
uniref:Mediator of RNA polymerase II transcription subunit 30 n=1 Tax=Echinostoma caproni TaxID=27848 RepID=A0A183A5Q3_9TREM